jgi:DNA end-binding protein Ku
MPRSLWNGTVAFGMVRVPVKLHAATESKAVRFHERHATDGAAIEHRRVCVQEDREVPYAEIVKGYEAEPGSYVVLSKEEVAAADGETARTIAIEHFVDGAEIDSLHYDHPYYLGPGKGGAEPYRLLHAALARSGRVGIARFTFHNRAQLVALRVLGPLLAVQTMRFADELVAPAEREIPEASAAGLRERELQTALLLIEQLSGDFEPEAYTDTYREELLALIERKARGETIEPPARVAPTGEDELLRALEASLQDGPRAAGARGRRGRESHDPDRAERPAGKGRGGAHPAAGRTRARGSAPAQTRRRG